MEPLMSVVNVRTGRPLFAESLRMTIRRMPGGGPAFKAARAVRRDGQPQAMTLYSLDATSGPFSSL